MPTSIIGTGTDVKQRMNALDLLRGLAVFLMIVVNALAIYDLIPAWLKHAPWNGYTLPDVVAPMFLFAIGVSYRLSLVKRLNAHGLRRTIFHFIFRYLVLFCFGFFGELLVLRQVGWGVLTMIGTVGIFTLSFTFFEPRRRIIFAFFGLGAYQIAVLLKMPLLFVSGGLGGPGATLAWGFIPLLASAIGDWIRDQEPKRISSVLIFWGSLLTGGGYLLSFFIPFNKHLVSASYVLFSTGISSFIFLGFYLLSDIRRAKFPLLLSVGRNALFLYIISNLLILVLNAMIPIQAPVLNVTLGTGLVVSICLGTGLLLNRWKYYIRL